MKLAPLLAYPTQQEKRYVNNLLRFSKRNRDLVKDDIVADLDSLVYSGDFDSVDNIEFILRELSAASINIADEEIERMLIILAAVTVFYLRQLSRYLPIPIINVNSFSLNNNFAFPELNDPIKAWATYNSQLIKSIPSRLLDDVAEVIYSAVRDDTDISIVKKQIINKFKVSDKRALFIAKDQIIKLTAAIRRIENQKYGIDNYKWRIEDIDARPSHRAMSGKICTYSDPTIYKDSLKDKAWRKRSSIGGVELHPGQDYRCRCEDQAILNET